MLKFVEASGSNFEIGYQIGEATKEEIPRNLEHFIDFTHNNVGLSKAEMQDFAKPFLERCQKVFPDYIEELKGISAGSYVSFEDLFLFSLEEEFEIPGSCSQIGKKYVGEAFIGHNEDFDLDHALYVARVTQEGKPNFLALSQCGNIPNLLGINQYGFSFASNSVDYNFNPEGLPKMYVLRKMLEIENVLDLVKYLQSAKRTLCCNLLVASGSEIYKVEWSQDAFNFSNEGILAQTNHFTLPGMISEQGESSRLRLLNLERSYSKEIKEILSNHDSYPSSVCRHEERKTIASAIIDVSGRRIEISDGSPCMNDYREFRL